MNGTDVVDQVYRSADFESQEQAEEVTFAILRNLGRSLSAGEAEDLAEFLPPDLANVLVDTERRPKPMSYETFLENVSDEARLEDSDVERRARAVVSVLAGRVGEEELGNAQAQLPPNYGRIFDIEPVTAPRLFVDLVAARGTFDAGVDVEATTRATLETLGERLSRGEAEDVSRYLDEVAGSWLIDLESPDSAAFSADEFVSRVAERAGVSDDTARDAIRVVAEVLADVVPSRELSNALEQLPSEFDSRFAFDG